MAVQSLDEPETILTETRTVPGDFQLRSFLLNFKTFYCAVCSVNSCRLGNRCWIANRR